MLKKSIIFLFISLMLLSVFRCKEEVLPKPASYLRLDYPEAEYVNFENNASPFAFEMNSEAVIQGGKDFGLTITYPKMKATIYLTYKPVNNNKNEK